MPAAGLGGGVAGAVNANDAARVARNSMVAAAVRRLDGGGARRVSGLAASSSRAVKGAATAAVGWAPAEPTDATDVSAPARDPATMAAVSRLWLEWSLLAMGWVA
jgi:hypothetical protein